MSGWDLFFSPPGGTILMLDGSAFDQRQQLVPYLQTNPAPVAGFFVSRRRSGAMARNRLATSELAFRWRCILIADGGRDRD
ncbi:hypothetical protein [Methylocystis echinoides]|uniref:hypothetical protein n=1 Tax=Methylocystis echinoides TaxID=29468 RepID=UPI00342A2E49